MDIKKLERQLNDGKEPAAPRIAILWGHADLLGEAIESILTAARNWQVIKVLDNQDVEVLIQEVEKTHPEIVIINQGHCAHSFPVPIHLIEDFPKLRVITINPDNNLVEIYNKQEICIEEASDLLSVIDKHSHPTAPGGENKP